MANEDHKNLLEGRSLLFELVHRSHIVGFDERAIVARGADQFGAAIGDVVVAWTVGCGRELLEELKVREGARVNRYSVMLSVEGR